MCRARRVNNFIFVFIVNALAFTDRQNKGEQHTECERTVVGGGQQQKFCSPKNASRHERKSKNGKEITKQKAKKCF